MIIGFAIVSSNGYLADYRGDMSMLAHDEDFKRLQERLSVPDTISVMGRVTHERHPNRQKRTRWILSRTIPTSEAANELFFDNHDLLLEKMKSCRDNAFHVLGGGSFYHIFGLSKLYDEFNLSVRRDIQLNCGLALCPNSLDDVNDVMRKWGLPHKAIDVCHYDSHLEFRKYTP